MLARIPTCGAAGVVKDLSQHDLPINVWSDARNVRFMNGSAMSFFGHSSVFGETSVVPYHLLPVTISGVRYWIYCGLKKVYAVTSAAGLTTHTNLTPQTAGVDIDLTGQPNTWTSTVIGGIPIVNPGQGSPPLYWDGKTTSRLKTVVAWPSTMTCKVLRSFKGFLVALNITKGASKYPYMVKWSSPAAPGALPSSWNELDPTIEAGDIDLAEGNDVIVDGLQLRDSFMIYKERSIWRMDYIGVPNVFSFQQVLGTSGAMNRNCIVEVDGWHFVLTGSDVIVHDGQSAKSVLDRKSRRHLFQSIDVNGFGLCFVFKSTFTNEVFVCYPRVGSTVCDEAMVWNYVDQTVTFKDIPNLHHAECGPAPSGLVQTWDSDSAPWASDSSLWGGPDLAPDSERVLMAPATPEILMLDSSAAQDGEQVAFYLERRGLPLDAPEQMKLIKGIRPRIYGNAGETVIIRVGGQDDPWGEPDWGDPVPFVIGEDVAADCFVSGRYVAIRFESGTAFEVRLDSYDIEYEMMGGW
ncbi:hypothetical protein OU994_18035 [Pseudoduganella sp. SL102]|uniref:hypothetical protein n=1 Tax=Pseudoduganella sp. SL102 TaxID=2995154 RepID=UPI00248B9797|nr:hypothetical protein [Pseudoduganella sp. SL102]WBS00221.1 hypothetical protein OU994_18035 [Pseudoduganella sp. SL102]